MERWVTVKRLTREEFVASQPEIELALAAADYFLETYLNEVASDRYKGKPNGEKLNLFRWENYLVARCWITSHKNLAACLTLKKSFKPWEVRRTKISQ